MFLIVVLIIVFGLIVYDANRPNPWNSDIFFGFNSTPAHQTG